MVEWLIIYYASHKLHSTRFKLIATFVLILCCATLVLNTRTTSWLIIQNDFSIFSCSFRRTSVVAELRLVSLFKYAQTLSTLTRPLHMTVVFLKTKWLKKIQKRFCYAPQSPYLFNYSTQIKAGKLQVTNNHMNKNKRADSCYQTNLWKSNNEIIHI